MSIPDGSLGSVMSDVAKKDKMATLVQALVLQMARQAASGRQGFQDVSAAAQLPAPNVNLGFGPMQGSLLQRPQVDAAPPQQLPPDPGPQPGGSKRCNCKKNKCLKLYCVCFSAGVFCSDCACKECLNTQRQQRVVMSERQKVIQRSPYAFTPKVEHDMTGDVGHKKGCRCKKSKCLKKYCECYDARVYCSANCKCEGCHNTQGDLNDGFEDGLNGLEGVAYGDEGEEGSQQPEDACPSRDQAPVSLWTDMGAGRNPRLGPDPGHPVLPCHHALEFASLAEAAELGHAMISDLKPSSSLARSGSFDGLWALGLGGGCSLAGSLGPSPMSIKRAARTNSAGSMDLAGRLQSLQQQEGGKERLLTAAGALPAGVPSLEGPQIHHASIQHASRLLDTGSMMHGMRGLPFATDSEMPMPPCNQQPIYMLLRPDVLVEDPENAMVLAQLLGLDDTHQKAAVKAATVLKQIIAAGLKNPMFRDSLLARQLEQSDGDAVQQPAPGHAHQTLPSHSYLSADPVSGVRPPAGASGQDGLAGCTPAAGPFDRRGTSHPQKWLFAGTTPASAGGQQQWQQQQPRAGAACGWSTPASNAVQHQQWHQQPSQQQQHTAGGSTPASAAVRSGVVAQTTSGTNRSTLQRLTSGMYKIAGTGGAARVSETGSRLPLHPNLVSPGGATLQRRDSGDGNTASGLHRTISMPNPFCTSLGQGLHAGPLIAQITAGGRLSHAASLPMPSISQASQGRQASGGHWGGGLPPSAGEEGGRGVKRARSHCSEDGDGLLGPRGGSQSQPEVSSGSDMVRNALNAMLGNSPQSRAMGTTCASPRSGYGGAGSARHGSGPYSRTQSPMGLPRNYSPVGRHGRGSTARPSMSVGSQGGKVVAEPTAQENFDSEMEVAQALFEMRSGS